MRIVKQITESRWGSVSVASLEEDHKLYGVLLGKHAPPQPERFRGMVEESYQEWVSKYQQSIAYPSDDIPEMLVPFANQLFGSMLATVEMLPEGKELSFPELVELHDVLAVKFASFLRSGNLLTERG